MASVYSLQVPAIRLRPRSLTSPSSQTKSTCKHRNQSTLCSEKAESSGKTRFCSDEGSGTKRREALLRILFSAFSFPSLVGGALAVETGLKENFRTYEDETNKFRILVPQDWQVGAGEANGFKSITAFYPKEASDSNVSIAITGVGADFTKLESFGTVDAFAENLVNGLDRSWKSPPGMAAKLINSKAANGLYYIEYTLQNPGERCRHIVSAIGMASNGWYNRLYTVSGQFVEDDSEKYRSQIEKVYLRKKCASEKN